jgi:HEPN domain-containing protein
MARLAKEPQRFFRAAQQWLAEAQFLLQNDYTTAAVYLAGYAVECMLKALILASEPHA